MFKKCKVVMLPTNEKAIIGDLALSHNNVLNFAKNEDWLVIYNPIKQHLYITSDEEIKDNFKGFAIVTVKDDIRIHYLVEVIVTEQNQCYCKEDRKFSFEYYLVKPIIATTDTSLNIKSFDKSKRINLPKPSNQFIEKYIEEYNKGNVITDVLVEYIDNGEEGWSGSNEDGKPIWNEKIELKVNPKDNTITIKKVKDSWNREEHIQDIKRIILLEREYQDLTHHFIDTIDLDKFITDKL